MHYFSVTVETLQFIRPLEDVTLNDIGLEARFECEISKADLKAEWKKGKKVIKKSDKYDISMDGKVHTLVMEKAQPEDESAYSIHFPDLTSSAKLTIQGKFAV